ncbi:threonine-phosphate decarboxylase CobD [Oscillatoria sp. CS-180]|uniref:threonine-phosphate decarboxylase CobD n=1 Tax=Oscillatoria sp. CS-180 TaxID=3021720 RepID=UPI00232DEE3B|nr:threonine-phosphate decarboxylase CobD [Oscillatoria sp. CS-180]MDB9529261.1 threonine-phosphate decarboxylase CobD [Oscillatoria sp. CS-180]
MEDIPFNTRPNHGGNVEWAAQVARCSPHDLLDFSASINPLGPPDSAIAAIHNNLDQLSRYPNPDYSTLKQALAHHHGISPAWILPGNGAAELLTWAARSLAELEAVYFFTPAFGDYQRSLTTFNAPTVACPISLTAAENNAVDWVTTLHQQLCHASNRCGLLLNTPHNPTGLVIPLDLLTELLETFALVVVDEAFMDFLPPEAQCSLIDQIERWPNLIVLRSLTKFYSLPGLRLGYAIAHPDQLQCWQQWRDPWPVNILAAAVGAAVLQDHDYQQQTWEWLATARSKLFEQLQAIPGLHPLPGQANYLLIRCDRPGSQLQLDLLKQHRILVRDCLSFPELGDRYIRVAVRSAKENAILVKALTQCKTIPS